MTLTGITNPSSIARIVAKMNTQLGNGWKPVLGERPLPSISVHIDTLGSGVTDWDIGDIWYGASGLYKTVPTQERDELEAMLRSAPHADGDGVGASGISVGATVAARDDRSFPPRYEDVGRCEKAPRNLPLAESEVALSGDFNSIFWGLEGSVMRLPVALLDRPDWPGHPPDWPGRTPIPEGALAALWSDYKKIRLSPAKPASDTCENIDGRVVFRFRTSTGNTRWLALGRGCPTIMADDLICHLDPSAFARLVDAAHVREQINVSDPTTVAYLADGGGRWTDGTGP